MYLGRIVESGTRELIFSRPRSRSGPRLSFDGADAEPYMAFGTPGGDQQDQWSLVFLLSHLQYGLNLQQAIARRPSTPHISRARSIPGGRSRGKSRSSRAWART
jgi:hypothetical protein